MVKTVPVRSGTGAVFKALKTPFNKHNLNNTKTQAEMIELFIELTDQLFWEGYAEWLAGENPALFQSEFKDFLNNYNK